MINLVSNAIKYTHRGGLVKLKAIKIDKFNYMIQVKDTGVGIEANEVPNLFRAFKKIKSDRALNKLGCGLGLTLSKKLSQALGGDL